MSLDETQIRNTKAELKANFEKSGLTIEKIAKDLGTDENYINDLFNLNPRRLEDTWILKNYLIADLNSKSIEVTPFTALVGESENYWFLNSNYINNGKII